MSLPALGPDELVVKLREGAVVLMPTDTLPGLHCRADFPDAVARVCALKGRDATKPLLVLCASITDAVGLCPGIDARARSYASRCWPGPFTLVMPAGPLVPPAATGGFDTVAIRVPGLESLRRLVTAVGAPLVSTSANTAGQEPATDLAEAVRRFDGRVDGVADSYRTDVTATNAATGCASTLIDLTTWPPRMLRRGTEPPPDPNPD